MFVAAPLLTSAASFTTNHQLWDAGPDILTLQQFLNVHGYPLAQTGVGSPGHETDIFGTHTYAALVKFQAAHALPQTGYFGPLTRALVNAIFASSSATSSPPQMNSGGSPISTSTPQVVPTTTTNMVATSTAPSTPAVPSNFYNWIPGGGGGASAGGGGSSDTTAPSVSLTAPSSGATVSGSSITLGATASDNIAVASVQFKVDGTNIGSAITSSPYTATWNSTGVSDGTHTLYAVAEDTSGNYATSSESVTIENTPVSISSISSGTPTTTSATVTWTTNQAASSTVLYGTTAAYGSASSSVSFVTSHSIILTGLTASTTYHFQLQATNAAGNYATSSDQAFTTDSGGVADTTPPTPPTNLTAVAASLNELDLSWTASTDNVGVTGYKVFRDSSQIATDTSGTTYADTGLTASSTHTYIVKAYDAAGNVSSSSNTATSTTGTWSDGFAAAPSGAAQYPTLLQGYAARPPWRVAGVDYAVGPQTTPIGDWSTISHAGVSLDTTHCWVLLSGSNITLDGYDFTTTHLGCPGVTIVDEGTGDTISNFKVDFVQAAPPIETSGSSNFTVEYGTIDGGSAAGEVGVDQDCIFTGLGNSITLKYVWVKNCPQHGLDANGPSTSQFDLFDSMMWFSGAHGDFVQAYSSSSTEAFDTFNQPAANGQGFPGGVVAAMNTSLPQSSTTISNIAFDNNTGVGIGATGHTSGPQAMETWVNWTPTGTGDTIQSPTAQNNYVTMSGNRFTVFAYDENNNFTTQPTVASPTLINNVNMESGSALPNYP